MTDREELKAEALQTISADYYYDLADTIDELTDDDLAAIIACQGDVNEEEKLFQTEPSTLIDPALATICDGCE